MKYVRATATSYDAAVGRIEVGTVYFVEDDKAERWIAAGIATSSRKPPDPEPEPDSEPDEEPDEEATEAEEEEDSDLAAEAKRLLEEGGSQRSIAEHLGISRDKVRRLLAA